MKLERRDYDFAPELRMDGDLTRITGYAAVFNRDSHDLGGFVEQVRPGAFKRVLERGDNVLALFNHSMDNLLATSAAGSLRLKEDGTGLRYEFDLDDTDPDHQRVIAKVKRGDLRGSSFAFRTSTDTDGWEATDTDHPRRIVNEVSILRDVGPVTTPAYGDTENVGKALALRSLADMTGETVDELAEADNLKDFLLRQDQPDVADDAHSQTDGDSSDERVAKPAPPAPVPDWYSTYKEVSK